VTLVYGRSRRFIIIIIIIIIIFVTASLNPLFVNWMQYAHTLFSWRLIVTCKMIWRELKYSRVRAKTVQLQDWTGIEGFKRLRPHISTQSAHEGGKVVSLTHRPPLLPRKYPWYSFLLETESIPGP
jgi:hypothetical protein